MHFGIGTQSETTFDFFCIFELTCQVRPHIIFLHFGNGTSSKTTFYFLHFGVGTESETTFDMASDDQLEGENSIFMSYSTSTLCYIVLQLVYDTLSGCFHTKHTKHF